MQETLPPPLNEPSHEKDVNKKEIPTEADIREQLKGIILPDQKCVRELSDKEGLYLMEFIVPGENPGEFAEYGYMRSGEHGRGFKKTTEITVAYYRDNDDIPYTGGTISEFENGVWSRKLDSTK